MGQDCFYRQLPLVGFQFLKIGQITGCTFWRQVVGCFYSLLIASILLEAIKSADAALKQTSGNTENQIKSKNISVMVGLNS